jgi:hypothetical protein
LQVNTSPAMRSSQAARPEHERRQAYFVPAM